MKKFFRALVVTSAATAVAMVVVAAVRKAGKFSETEPTGEIQKPEIDADNLPPEVREDLVAELEGHV